MSKKANYPKRDVQFIERIYLLGLNEYLQSLPTNSEIDFLEETIEKQRKKVIDLKTELYENNNNKKANAAFFSENLKRQSIYLDLLVEKKKIFEGKKIR